MSDAGSPPPLVRLRLLAVAAAVIAIGLGLRLMPWGLPLRVTHGLGGLLWAAVVFVLIAALRPARWSSAHCVALSLAVALAVEISRLIQTPGLDAFRATLPGQLLLGRIFSAWNLATYAAGILSCAVLTTAASRRRKPAPHDPVKTQDTR